MCIVHVFIRSVSSSNTSFSRFFSFSAHQIACTQWKIMQQFRVYTVKSKISILKQLYSKNYPKFIGNHKTIGYATQLITLKFTKLDDVTLPCDMEAITDAKMNIVMKLCCAWIYFNVHNGTGCQLPTNLPYWICIQNGIWFPLHKMLPSIRMEYDIEALAFTDIYISFSILFDAIYSFCMSCDSFAKKRIKDRNCSHITASFQFELCHFESRILSVFLHFNQPIFFLFLFFLVSSSSSSCFSFE